MKTVRALAAITGATVAVAIAPPLTSLAAGAPGPRAAAARTGAGHSRRHHRHHGHHLARRASRAQYSGQAGEQVALLSKVLATPCQDTELQPEAANLGLVRAAVLCLINDERARNGDSPLSTNGKLQAAGEAHMQDMLAHDYFAHVSPSGSTPAQRMRESGYIANEHVGYAVGENLAWGTLSLATPRAIVAAWMASPEHRANILDGAYSETGIAVAPAVPSAFGGGEAGATYAQEFGTITG